MFFGTLAILLTSLSFSNVVNHYESYNNACLDVQVTGNIQDIISENSGSDRFYINASLTDNSVIETNRIFYFYIEPNSNAYCEYGWDGFSNVSYYFDLNIYYNNLNIFTFNSDYVAEYCSPTEDNVSHDNFGFSIENWFTITHNDYSNTTYNLNIKFFLLDANSYSHYLEDYENGYNLGYGQGYSDGNSDGYDSGYHNGYDDGQSVGYQQGLVDGYNNADMSFIFSGIVQVGMLPVNFFLAILNWEIFGINIGGFVQGLLSLALILIVIRFVIGNFGGGKE